MQFFAQADTSMTWVQPIVQLVTAGGFGALVWYMVTKYIPAIEERHRKEREATEVRHLTERDAWNERHNNDRTEWLGYIRLRDDSFERLMREQLKALSEMRSEFKDLGAKIDTRT